jgi:hypothetical protein
MVSPMQGAQRRSMGFTMGGVSLRSGLEEGEHGRDVVVVEHGRDVVVVGHGRDVVVVGHGHGGMMYIAWLQMPTYKYLSSITIPSFAAICNNSSRHDMRL